VNSIIYGFVFLNSLFCTNLEFDMIQSLALSLTTLGENQKAINLICTILDCPHPVFDSESYRSDQVKLLSRLNFSEVPNRIRHNPDLLGYNISVNFISK
jgi:hypothetical protein